jgi:Pyruvate/2-oxoacid:ferredoxin oxidoreductase delta subunit
MGNKHDQFDESSNGTMPCAVCEAMCPEAVDGTLTAAEQAVFDRHVAGCASCADELAEAHRGAAWMQMLKGHAPEPPAALLAKILAETSGPVAPQAVVMPAFVPETEYLPQPVQAGWWATMSMRMSETFSLQRMSLQPRLAMTAAMAFFSLALTLNMAGVQLRNFRLNMLRPSSIQRSVADASASATRSFQNLRVVYEFESRVSDLRDSGELGQQFENNQNTATPFAGQNDAAQQQQPSQQQQPAKGPQQ